MGGPAGRPSARMRTRVDGCGRRCDRQQRIDGDGQPALAVKGGRVPAANNPQWAAVGLQDGAALLARVTVDGLPVVCESDPNRPGGVRTIPPRCSAAPTTSSPPHRQPQPADHRARYRPLTRPRRPAARPHVQCGPAAAHLRTSPSATARVRCLSLSTIPTGAAGSREGRPRRGESSVLTPPAGSDPSATVIRLR